MKVIDEVMKGHLTQGEAGNQLGISERQVRRLVRRVEKEAQELVENWRLEYNRPRQELR